MFPRASTQTVADCLRSGDAPEIDFVVTVSGARFTALAARHGRHRVPSSFGTEQRNCYLNAVLSTSFGS